MATSQPKLWKDGDDGTIGQFTDPAFKKLSQMNGEINKMNKQQLKERLEELQMDSKGVKEVLRKRLKNYYKKRVLNKVSQQPAYSNVPDYDFYLVIDFEATCQEQNTPDFKHEIIEFPIVLVDAMEMKVVDEFQSFVRPLVQPKLTEFCTTLTGITQSQVDKAPVFAEVLGRVEEWKLSHRLGEAGRDFAVLTDGPWDMSRFMHIQCYTSNLEFPKWALKWVNVRKAYANFYDCKRMKLRDMMEHQGLPFQGQLHSGIDDSKNIASIAIKMLQDGAKLRINERLTLSKGDNGTLQVVVRNVTSSQSKSKKMRNRADNNSEREENEDLQGITESLDQIEVNDGEIEAHDGSGDWNVVKSKKEKKMEKINWAEEVGDDSGDGADDDDLLYYHTLQQRDAKTKFEYDFGGR